MRKEYDFKNGIKNPYVSKLIRNDNNITSTILEETIDLFPLTNEEKERINSIKEVHPNWFNKK